MVFVRGRRQYMNTIISASIYAKFVIREIVLLTTRTTGIGVGKEG